MQTKVDVTIVSANYCNGRYLTQFMDSLLSSSFLPKEIIIVDDGSTDNSLEVLRKYESDTLRVIPLKNNIGFANALNVGIRAATSKYVARVDTDDFVRKDRIEIQYRHMEDHPETDVLGSNCSFCDDQNREILRTNVPLRHDEIESRVRKGLHGVVHGTVLCRAGVFKAYPFRQSSYPAEEYDIFARMLKGGHRFENLSEALTYVRVHSNSVSNRMPLSTVRKTFDLKAEIFEARTNPLAVLQQFAHVHFYRRALFQRNLLVRGVYLAISAIFRPSRLVARIISREFPNDK